MGFLGLHPWHKPLFERHLVPTGVAIPMSDAEAYKAYPQHNWVYDKLAVARTQDIPCAPHGVMPTHFPVFSKPIINLRGMGEGSRCLANMREMEHWYRPGHFWMPVLAGEHVTSDAVVVDGQVQWWRHGTCCPREGGMVDHWKIEGGRRPDHEDLLAAWIERYLPGYTGLFNAETLGSVLIEVHLRIGVWYVDLYGDAWISAVIRLFADGIWDFDECDDERRDGFSIDLFAPHGSCYRVDAARAAHLLDWPGVVGLQLPLDPDGYPERLANPPGGVLIGVVNSRSLEVGHAARDWLSTCYQRVEDVSS